VISFIVPAFNEELELPATLGAIHSAATGAKQEYEIIVVDDASTDSTAEIAQRNGAEVVSVNRRQIAAARNAGARAARGETLFFVDADTQIHARHVVDAISALEAGFAGGSARLIASGDIPRWGRIFMKTFCALYFGVKLGAGAFLFSSRKNFEAAGGFDEQFFIGEEIYFSIALKRLGRFKILSEPVITSGRKLRMYSGRKVFLRTMSILLGGPNAARSRRKLDLWYDGKRETRSALR
jgi:glycosyltransferase involved in cell wall biosynthesis